MTEDAFCWNDASRERVRQVIDRHRSLDGPLLPVLHAIQAALGHVPPQAIPEVATALNLSRAEVHGVVTYYHHFRQQPAARIVLHVCRAEACQAMGGQVLYDHACARVASQPQEPGLADRFEPALALESTYCLGLCALAPAVSLERDGMVTPHARMTPARLDALLDGQAAP